VKEMRFKLASEKTREREVELAKGIVIRRKETNTHILWFWQGPEAKSLRTQPFFLTDLL
jgi:hypothetical protein